MSYEDWRFEPAAALTAGGGIEDQHRLWLAIEERTTSDVVGLAELLLPAPDGMAWIGLLVIEPRRRNCGLGGELLAELERSLGADGWTELRLSVALANDGAQRFWEREGYRELHGAWRCYDGLRPTSIVLSKFLQAPLSR